MLNVIKTALVCISSLLVLFLISTFLQRAVAGETVELDKVDITYRDFFPGGRDPLITDTGIPNRQLGKEVSLNVDTNIITYFYWNNRIHGMTDEVTNSGGRGQFRAVGWEFDVGFQLLNFLSLGYHHHSQHVLDHEAPFNWPVQDAVFINVVLFSKHKKEGVINW